MYILKCYYPLNPRMDPVDIFTGHVSAAHPQLIYSAGLEPPQTAELPTRSTQQWLGNDRNQSQQQQSHGCQTRTINWGQSLREGVLFAELAQT